MPQAISDRVQGASDSERNPVCSNENLGGGGLGGGGLQAESNRVRVQTARQDILRQQQRAPKQHCGHNKRIHLRHSQCSISSALQ